MNNSQDTILEYLWYIQHLIILDQEFELRHPSQRERANLLYGEGYYKQFARYELPRGAILSQIDPTDAPRNITFNHIGNEIYLLEEKIFRVLVTKKPYYPTIKTTETKDPYASIRMLVGLPHTFSLRDAITLGESTFWLQPDASKILSLRELTKLYTNDSLEQFNPYTNANMIKNYIPFIIQAYLLQKSHFNYPINEKPRILIAAPSDDVAYLIKLLSKCIPLQLLQGTTFSTYEHDIQHQNYDICGTCLLQKDESKYEKYLDFSSYQNDFVLNTYASQRNQIHKPANIPHDLWEKVHIYAETASEAFTNKRSYESLRIFIKQIEKFPELSIDAFLDHYSAYFSTSPQEIPTYTRVQTGTHPINRDPNSFTRSPEQPNRHFKESIDSPISPPTKSRPEASSPPPSAQPSVPSSTFGESLPPVAPTNTYPKEASSPLPYKQPSEPLDAAETLLHSLISQTDNSPIPQIPAASDEDVAGPTQQLVEPPSTFSPGIPEYTNQATFPAKDNTPIQKQINASNSLEARAANMHYHSQREPTTISSSPETREESSLSHEKIIEALDDPKQAKKLLENEQKRKRMIEYMLNNTAWTEQNVAPRWALLRNSDKKTSKLPSTMESLIHDIHDITAKAMEKEDRKRFQRSLVILPLLSPYKEDDKLWHDFFTILPSETQNIPLSLDAWFFRKNLLRVAREALYPDKKEDDKIVQKLLEVAPEDFSELISKSDDSSQIVGLPARWSYMATRYFVASITPNDEAAIRKNIQYFKRYTNTVENLFEYFVALEDFADKWTVISKFFKLLIDYGYAAHSKPILFKIIAAHPPQNKASEFIVSLTKLGQLTPADHLHIFKLNEALCIEQFTSQTLFREITLESLPRLPLTWERMNTLYLMLEKGPAKKINAVIENLADVLNTCIDSPIRLGMLFSSLTQQDNATARSLLLSMAQRCREDITEPIRSEISDYNNIGSQQIKKRFAHYMQFLLNPDGPYYNNAIKDEMLNELLANPDERIASFITEEAAYWPVELLHAWEYKQKSYMPPPHPGVAVVSLDPVNNSASSAPPAKPDDNQMLVFIQEEEKMRQRLKKLFKKPSIHNLARFWQENYIALQILITQTQDQDIKDSFQRLQRAYNLHQAIEKARRPTKDSQDALEFAILQAYRETINNHDGLLPTRKEGNRLDLAHKRTKP